MDEKCKIILAMLAVRLVGTGTQLLSEIALAKGSPVLPFLGYMHILGALVVVAFSAYYERSMAATTCEVQWILYLMRDLGISHDQPVPMYCDNRSAIYIAENQVFHERTKHVEIDCHIVREKLEKGIIKPIPVKTEVQVADVFTKPFEKSKLTWMLKALGTFNIFCKDSLREGVKDAARTEQAKESVKDYDPKAQVHS